MAHNIPATKPYFSDEDIAFVTERVAEIMRGESFLSMGKYGEELEKSFAQYVGTAHAVACNSGTSALELIWRGLGIEGKEVIMPSNTFFATAIAIVNAGGTPIFADCDDTMCMDADDALRRITPKTAGICQVHIGGVVSGATTRLAKECKDRGLLFVEDACQAHGSRLDGKLSGSFGVAGAFSFFSTKVMTAGEGGLVTTNDPALTAKMKSGREFGKVRKGIFTNWHESWGYNWRLHEFCSLLAIRQLAALDGFIARRQEIAAVYDEELSGVGSIRIVRPTDAAGHNFFKYIVILEEHDRVAVHQGLTAAGIAPSGYVYEVPLHKQPVFPTWNDVSLPNTEHVCAKHLCLPIFVGLSNEDARTVATELKKLVGYG